MANQIQLRRGTLATWTAANPILALGEIGYETDTQRFRIGDGATQFLTLPSYSRDEDPSTAHLRAVSPVLHQNNDWHTLAGATGLGNNTLQLASLWVPDTRPITGVAFEMDTQGNYTANNNNKVGLYSSDGTTLTLVASSANDGNLWKAAVGGAQKAFSAPYTPPAPGVYFIGALWNQSALVQAPLLGRQAALTTNASKQWGNKSILHGTVAGQNDLPATQALSGVTATLNPLWFGLY